MKKSVILVMTAEVNYCASCHKVEPKIEREIVLIKKNTLRTERFFFVAIERK